MLLRSANFGIEKVVYLGGGQFNSGHAVHGEDERNRCIGVGRVKCSLRLRAKDEYVVTYFTKSEKASEHPSCPATPGWTLLKGALLGLAYLFGLCGVRIGLCRGRGNLLLRTFGSDRLLWWWETRVGSGHRLHWCLNLIVVD
jgi:hypothetical protein